MTKKILLVEDEAIIALDIKFKLEDLGYEVYIADNGEDAIELCKDKSPNLVVADINIKGDMNGITMGETLSHDGFKVIFLSANPNNVEINLKEGEELIYIKKPLNINEFTETVERII